jgi:hypothetical protein
LLSSEKKSRRGGNSKVTTTTKEFNYQAFRRSFSLPDYADENKITADYKDGILHVAIDKRGAQQRIAKTSLLNKRTNFTVKSCKINHNHFKMILRFFIQIRMLKLIVL